MRFVCVLLLLSGTALAQSADEQGARVHFMAGSSYYEHENYDAAVREFNEAFRLSHRAELLYNIALCYEHLQRNDDAVRTLKQYLTERPNAPDRATIEARIAKDSAPQTAYATPPPERPSFIRRHVASTVTAGVAALSLLSAIGTGVSAHQIHNQLDAACPMRTCSADLQSKRDRGQALAVATDALIGVGVAAAAVSVVLFVLEIKKPFYKASLMPAPGGAQVIF